MSSWCLASSWKLWKPLRSITSSTSELSLSTVPFPKEPTCRTQESRHPEATAWTRQSLMLFSRMIATALRDGRGVFPFLKIIYLFILGCIGSSLLRARAFSSCGERGLLFIAVHGLLIAVASLVAEHGL